MLGRLYRYAVYFRRGHNVYLVFLVSLANFVVIQYRLLLQQIASLQALFPTLAFFILAFAPTYIAAATLIGWWDYRKGTVRVESRVAAEVSPFFTDLAKALYLSMDGKNEEARAILKGWVVAEESQTKRG